MTPHSQDMCGGGFRALVPEHRSFPLHSTTRVRWGAMGRERRHWAAQAGGVADNSRPGLWDQGVPVRLLGKTLGPLFLHQGHTPSEESSRTAPFLKTNLTGPLPSGTDVLAWGTYHGSFSFQGLCLEGFPPPALPVPPPPAASNPSLGVLCQAERK